MPTTSLSAYSFANHGPLTTVFTPPSSCFSSTSQILLASVTSDSDTNKTSIGPALGLCNTGLPYWAMPGDCIPSGRVIESQYAALDPSNPTAFAIIDYYSPGLYCPSNYVTVGVATNDAGTITSSGDGFVPSTDLYIGLGVFNPVPNILLQGLDRGETAVLCCPSSFQVDVYGNRYSPLPSHPLPSEVCYTSLPSEDITLISETVSIFGTAATEGIAVATNAVLATEVITQTITGTDTESSAVFSMAPMITLVHNAAETTASRSPPSTTTTKSGASSNQQPTNLAVVLLDRQFYNQCFLSIAAIRSPLGKIEFTRWSIKNFKLSPLMSHPRARRIHHRNVSTRGERSEV